MTRAGGAERHQSLRPPVQLSATSPPSWRGALPPSSHGGAGDQSPVKIFSLLLKNFERTTPPGSKSPQGTIDAAFPPVSYFLLSMVAPLKGKRGADSEALHKLYSHKVVKQ